METAGHTEPNAHRGRWPAPSLAAALALALALALPAVGGAAAAPGTLPPGVGDELGVQYVGAVPGSAAYAAVVDTGFGLVRVYLCDGESLGLWLEGSVSEGAFEAAAPDGATVSGTLDGARAMGSALLADGTTLQLELDRAELPAGLYERYALEDGELVGARTIVLADGTARGLKRSLGLGYINPTSDL